MRNSKIFFVLILTAFSFQFLFHPNAFATKTAKPKSCHTALRISAKEKKLKHLLEAGFSKSVALRILNYYPKNLFRSFFKKENLKMSLVYRGIGNGEDYDPIYNMSYFNVIEDPFDALYESQKWIKVRPFKINDVLYDGFVLELELPNSIYPGDDDNWKIYPYKIPNDAIFIRQIGLMNAKSGEFIWIPYNELKKYGFKFDLKKKRSED